MAADRDRADLGSADRGRADREGTALASAGRNHVGRDRASGDVDVDARFLLANERTLLAWVRTSLTLMIAGAGLEQFGSSFRYQTWLAAGMLTLGVAAAAIGAVRHARADRAIRRGDLPSSGLGHYAVAVIVALIGLALLVALAVGQ